MRLGTGPKQPTTASQQGFSLGGLRPRSSPSGPSIQLSLGPNPCQRREDKHRLAAVAGATIFLLEGGGDLVICVEDRTVMTTVPGHSAWPQCLAWLQGWSRVRVFVCLAGLPLLSAAPRLSVYDGAAYEHMQAITFSLQHVGQ